MTDAKVIADSISPAGHRLTTMQVTMHRFVLAEANTHRVFSRNSASSRAIPVAKQLARVRENPAYPVSWPAEQKGMQGGDELPEHAIAAMRSGWDMAAMHVTNIAQSMSEFGLHKSVTNRLLEPFMWHTVIITATAWQNFFGLRCNPMAQPEIRVAAEMMEAVYNASEPVKLAAGEWHTPYIDEVTRQEAADTFGPEGDHEGYWSALVKVSAARCARVSHLTQEGVRDVREDIGLYDRLTSADPMHASPLEHVATPYDDNVDRPVIVSRPSGNTMQLLLPRYGNFVGWHQHRFDVEVDRNYRAFA